MSECISVFIKSIFRTGEPAPSRFGRVEGLGLGPDFFSFALGPLKGFVGFSNRIELPGLKKP